MNPLKLLWSTIKKNDTAILTGVTIVSGVAAVIFTWKARPKCEEILDRLNAEGADAKEKAKELLPVVAPAAISTVVCVGSALLNQKRTGDKLSKLASVAQIGQVVRDEYVKSTKEIVGEEKANEIAVNAARNVAERTPVPDDVYDTGNGKFIFREPFTGITIRTTRGKIEQAIAMCNNDLANAKRKNDDSYECTVSDLFEAMGVPREKIPACARMFSWKSGHEEIIGADLTQTFDYNGEEPGYLITFSRYGRPSLAFYSDDGVPYYW